MIFKKGGFVRGGAGRRRGGGGKGKLAVILRVCHRTSNPDVLVGNFV